jgi:CheY-like chemotaxis protein
MVLNGLRFARYLLFSKRSVAEKGVFRMNDNEKRMATVLVVEDEDLLLSLNRMMLEASGYSVLTARDGVEALQLAKKYSGSIDLLLTDVRMPRMGGCELVDEFRSISPDSKVLYMTGSSVFELR